MTTKSQNRRTAAHADQCFHRFKRYRDLLRQTAVAAQLSAPLFYSDVLDGVECDTFYDLSEIRGNARYHRFQERRHGIGEDYLERAFHREIVYHDFHISRAIRATRIAYYKALVLSPFAAGSDSRSGSDKK